MIDSIEEELFQLKGHRSRYASCVRDLFGTLTFYDIQTTNGMFQLWEWSWWGGPVYEFRFKDGYFTKGNSLG